MKSVSSLKPHDIALLLKILSKDKSDWKQLDIALELKISQGEVASGGGKKNIKALGNGIFEIKINFGPGYRVYFGEDGNLLFYFSLEEIRVVKMQI